jgi:hypothetical protein
MSTCEHMIVSEFQNLLQRVKLTPKTRLTVTFEDDRSAFEVLEKKRVAEAMHKLRGSGNGNLVTVLLKEREKDKFR